MWLLPEVSGVSPRPCSGCSLTDIGGERRVLLGGLQKGDCCAGSMESVVILDMSASVWVKRVLHYPAPRMRSEGVK